MTGTLTGVSQTPIERLAAALISRRDHGPKCRVCGVRAGDSSFEFCCEEHADLWTRENAW